MPVQQFSPERFDFVSYQRSNSSSPPSDSNMNTTAPSLRPSPIGTFDRSIDRNRMPPCSPKGNKLDFTQWQPATPGGILTQQLTPDGSPEGYRSSGTSGYGSGRKRGEEPEWSGSNSSGSQEDLVSSSSLASSPRKSCTSNQYSNNRYGRLQTVGKRLVLSESSNSSVSPPIDSKGFVDAVPFPCPPRRNVFIEPGSGMRDVPMWLKSLRLHKYTPLFQQMGYEEMLSLTEDRLEKENVTKGARHKIFICIQKLKDRVEHLKQLEKDLIEPGSLRTTLGELKQMIMTPIRPFPPPGRPEPDQTKIDGIDVPGDDLDDENLPAHFTRVVGKLGMQMFAVQAIGEQEDENFGTLLHILDRCINHEAFTQAQKRRVINYKQVVKRVWNPSTSPGFARRNSSGSQRLGDNGSCNGAPSRTGSWKGDNRRNRTVPGKWNVGSPPHTRKWSEGRNNTTAAPCGLTPDFNQEYNRVMGNGNYPSQFMQNAQLHAMLTVLASQNPQHPQQLGNTGKGYCCPESGNPSMQRTVSLPPIGSIQHMALALAQAASTAPNNGVMSSCQQPQTRAPLGLNIPQAPTLPSQPTGSSIQNGGLNVNCHAGDHDLSSPLGPNGNSSGESTVSPVRSTPGDPGLLSPANRNSHCPRLPYGHLTSQSRAGQASPNGSSWGGEILNQVQWASQGYGNGHSDSKLHPSVTTATTTSSSSPNPVLDSRSYLNPQLSAPAGYPLLNYCPNYQNGIDGVGKMSTHSSHHDVPKINGVKSLSMSGEYRVPSESQPREIPNLAPIGYGRNTSPSPLTAYAFPGTGSCSDINSRMEKLCRRVAEAAIGNSYDGESFNFSSVLPGISSGI